MKPQVIVFDVNETLSDISFLDARFAEVGAPELLRPVWFSSVLRDGFALATSGTQAKFSTIGADALRSVFAGTTLNRDVEDAVQHVMAGFSTLPVHEDVPAGIRALRASGRRLVTLTNGATAVAEGLLGSSGLLDQFETLLSVEDANLWKPGLGAYEHAAQRCETPLGDMLLVAVHPWDIDGAARAGMSTAWINRDAKPYPSYFKEPDYTVTALDQLAAELKD